MWRWVDHPQITIPNSTHIIKLTNAASSGKVEKIPVTHPEILRRILPPISKFTYIWSFISYLGSIFLSFKISFSCLESLPLSLFNNQIYQLCCIFIIYQSLLKQQSDCTIAPILNAFSAWTLLLDLILGDLLLYSAGAKSFRGRSCFLFL